jgi:cyclase
MGWSGYIPRMTGAKPGKRFVRAGRYLALALISVLPIQVQAAPTVKQIGPGLYAYISDNDSSANSTFLVGHKSILVVDTGLNETEGRKLLQAIRDVSPLPVQYIVNTHYHPDHQGGNTAFNPAAVVISTEWTRERTLQLTGSLTLAQGSRFRPAELTFHQRITVHLEPYTAEIYFPGKAHTSGDALVYFPQQRAIAMGDLFLNRASPAMDEGSVKSWIEALDGVLDLPVDSVVPGHFELGAKAELRRFRNYLNDLYEQVRVLYREGASVEQVRQQIHMEQYQDFRQYPQFEATFADNAATIYQQLKRQY